MPFLGSQPADQYQSLAKQTITGDGSTSYTLNRSVTNAYDMEVFINNVRQEPDTSYTASGNTITFTAAVTASDSCYLIYQGQSVGSINPPANSVGGNEIQNTSVTHNHLHTNMDLSSKTVRIDAMDMSSSTNKMQMAIQSNVSNRFALRSTHTADYDNNPFIVYQPSSAGVQNDALVINADGYILKNKQPSFIAKGNNGAYINTSPVPFPTVDQNIGNGYNNSNYTFTAPVAGTYLFHLHMGLTQGHNNQQLYPMFQINGANQTYTYQALNASVGHSNCNMTQLFALSANDAVRVAFYYGSSSGTYYNNAAECRFMGILLG